MKSAHHDMTLKAKQLSGQLEMELFSRADYFPSALFTGWGGWYYSQGKEQTVKPLSLRYLVRLNGLSQKSVGWGAH